VKNQAVLVVAALAGLAIGTLVMLPSLAPRQPATFSSVSAVSWQPAARQVVSLSDYERIRPGMSYFEVRMIIGDGGTELSRSHLDGVAGVMESIDTVMYGWSNANGSNMNAMFQNDKLIQKAQFGLR